MCSELSLFLISTFLPYREIEDFYVCGPHGLLSVKGTPTSPASRGKTLLVYSRRALPVDSYPVARGSCCPAVLTAGRLRVSAHSVSGVQCLVPDPRPCISLLLHTGVYNGIPLSARISAAAAAPAGAVFSRGGDTLTSLPISLCFVEPLEGRLINFHTFADFLDLKKLNAVVV